MTTLSPRKTERIFTGTLGKRAKSVTSNPEPIDVDLIDQGEIEPEPITAAPVYNGFESLAFLKLVSKNPAMLALASALDLVVVASTVIIPEPLPSLAKRMPEEPVNPKLKAIAHRAFARCQSYTKSEAIERLAFATNVTPDRARNGLAMMYAQDIVSLTLSNEYYLTESTPF